MTRTTIRATASNYVSISYDCPLTGERIEREFSVPRNGEDVREFDKQVCEYLANMGPALCVNDQSDLLPVIRCEWRKAITA